MAGLARFTNFLGQYFYARAILWKIQCGSVEGFSQKTRMLAEPIVILEPRESWLQIVCEGAKCLYVLNYIGGLASVCLPGSIKLCGMRLH